MRGNRAPLLGENLSIDDCGKQESVEEKREILVFGPGRKDAGRLETDRVEMLVLNSAVAGLLVLAEPVADQSMTTEQFLLISSVRQSAGANTPLKSIQAYQ